MCAGSIGSAQIKCKFNAILEDGIRISELGGGNLKRISRALILALTLMCLSAPARAQQEDPTTPGTLRFQVSDTWRFGDGSRIGLFTEVNGKRIFHGYCESLAKGYTSSAPRNSSCDPADYRVKIFPSVELVAPVCEELKSFCLDSVHAVVNGSKISGRSVGYISDSRVEAIPKFGIPSGRSSSIWQIPGVTHSGGSDYYQVKLDLIANVGLWFYIIDGRLGERRPLEITNFELVIRPVTLTRIDDSTSAVLCGECDMPESATFQADAFLNHDILGMKWFYSRILDAEVAISKALGNQYKYSISGRPMPLQTLDARKNYSDAPEGLIQVHTRGLDCYATAPTSNCWRKIINGNRPWEAEELLAAWRPVLNDAATEIVSQWFIRSNYQDSGQWFSDMKFFRCSPKDRAAGIVTSNALMTTGSIPEYKNGSLNYKVSSLHWEKDGVTPYRGYYEFVMDEKLARCLFNLPSVPISAKITVRGGSETSDVETNVLGNKRGQLRFIAANFSYSSKIISVSFTPRGYKLCTRGSVVRYIKSAKCPAGFR